MRKHVAYLLSFVVILLWSCQKEVDDPNMQPGTGTTSTGNYLPLTKDTYWKFKDSASGAFTTLTVLDKTRSINGRLYTAVLGSNTSQTDTFYMTKQGADYFEYAEAGNGTSSGMFLFHYLNDTAATGQSWEYLAGEGNGFPAYIKTTIMERGVSRTVQSKTYTDVIHTRMEMSYDISGERMSAATYDYYIANGIGIIQVKSNMDMLGVQMVASSDLVEYQVK